MLHGSRHEPHTAYVQIAVSLKNFASTPAIPLINTLPVGNVSITGQASQGQCLLASHSLWDDDGMGNVTYQWYVNGVPTSTGYRSEYYVIQQADVGKIITVKASYTDGAGHPEAVLSAGTSTVLNVNDRPDLANLILPGRVQTDLGGHENVRCSVLQADGKLILGGASGNSLALVRYNSDGSLDDSFDGDGKLLLNGAYAGTALSVVPLPDGKLLVGGTRTVSSGATSSTALQLIRLETNGSIDSSYGLHGQVTIQDYLYLFNLELQSDGSLLISANKNTTTNNLIKLKANGSVDETFGVKGILEPGGRSGFMVLPDGNILVGVILDGNSSQGYHFNLSKFHANGVDTASLMPSEITQSVTIQLLDSLGSQKVKSAGGNAVLSARFGVEAGDVNYVVQRWLWPSMDLFQLKQDTDHSISGFLPPTIGSSAEPHLDKSFGFAGYAVADISPFDTPDSMVIQSDGKILVSGDVLSPQTTSFRLSYYTDTGSWGASSSGGGNDFAVVRFNADGSLDTRYGIPSTVTGAANYKEGDAPVALSPTVSVSDLDAQATGNYGGLTLSLQRSGGASPKDVFSIATEGSNLAILANHDLTEQGRVIGTVSQQSGQLTISFAGAGATEALVNQVLQHIQYRNTSGTPPASLTMDWTFSDGVATSTGLSQVVLTNVADAQSSLDRWVVKKWNDNAIVRDFYLKEGSLVKSAPVDKTQSGVSLTDVLAALKIYLGKTADTQSPFSVLAADFNADGAVTLGDVLQLLKYYLGKSTGGIAPQWVFVNATDVVDQSGHQVIVGLDGHALSKTSTFIPLPDADVLMADSINVIGVLRGDVDGSWTGT